MAQTKRLAPRRPTLEPCPHCAQPMRAPKAPRPAAPVVELPAGFARMRHQFYKALMTAGAAPCPRCGDYLYPEHVAHCDGVPQTVRPGIREWCDGIAAHARALDTPTPAEG